MNSGRDRRNLWWLAGGIAAGVLGYLAVRYPVETATKIGAAHLKLLGGTTHEIPWSEGTIRYVMLGRGTRPLVLVHGIGDSPESYGLLAQGLLRDYRICIPILPGHPGTPAPRDLQFGHMVQALDAVILREFGAKPVHLYGNSLGGWVAALFAAAASERLASLMLVNPAGQHDKFRTELVIPSNEEEAAVTLRVLFGRNAAHIPRATRYAIARALHARSEPAVARMMEEAPRLEAPLERITTRTIVVIGDRDRLVPPEQSLRIAERIGHATVSVIAGGSHVPHLTDIGELRRIVNRHTNDPHLLET